MGKPSVVKPLPGPQGRWSIELQFAGQSFHSKAMTEDEARRSFARMAGRCRHGQVDRLTLWRGSDCVDVAIPGAATAHRTPTTTGLAIAQADIAGTSTPPGEIQIHKLPGMGQARGSSSLSTKELGL